jgi:hypothetical protein
LARDAGPVELRMGSSSACRAPDTLLRAWRGVSRMRGLAERSEAAARDVAGSGALIARSTHRRGGGLAVVHGRPWPSAIVAPPRQATRAGCGPIRPAARVATNDYYARMQIQTPTFSTTRAVSPRRGASVAATALACAVLVSACGSSSSSNGSGAAKTNLNTAHVAVAIEQTLLEKRRLHAKVVCPAAVPQEAGKTFECIATSTAVKPPHAVTNTPFLVTIQNNRGYVTYVGK